MSYTLVTGARGFIGRHLVARLAQRNHEVIGIGHGDCSEREFELSGLKAWIDADISAPSLLKLLKERGIPENIFHLAGGSSVGAAFADPQGDYSRTVTSTAILLEWMRCHASMTRLVVVSSAAVYGSGHEGGIYEQAQLTPFSPYGAHKLMMEILCQSYATNFDLKIVIPRLFSVYGTELRKQLLWDLCNKLNLDDEIKLGGSGSELRDWTHISDVVEGLEAAVDIASNIAPVLNLATGIATPVAEIAAMVAAQWDGPDTRHRLSFSGAPRAGDPFSLVADTSALQERGFVCAKSLAPGIAEYVAWFRKQQDSD
jgi:UDP-glucose 4-epimerase